jgi:hypothetical protein
MPRLVVSTVAALLTAILVAPCTLAQDKKDAATLDQSEEMAKQYLDAFKKSGVPSPGAIDAAVKKAQSAGTIDAWTEAAGVANSYANVIDVLTNHYSKLYHASRDSRGQGNYGYISTAAKYEKIRNRYLAIRNDAYIQLARLYLSKGDQAKALSYVVTAVKLSGAEPNTAGEQLIKQIVNYSE